jgi:hypothetical protein
VQRVLVSNGKVTGLEYKDSMVGTKELKDLDGCVLALGAKGMKVHGASHMRCQMSRRCTAK